MTPDVPAPAPGEATSRTAIGALLAVAAMVADAGLGLVVSRDVAVKPALAPRVLAATLVLQPALAAVAAVGVYFAIAGGGPLEVPAALAALATLALLTDTLGNLCHNLLVAAERLTTTAVIAVVHACVLAAAGSALVLGGLGLWGVYAAILGASAARAALYGLRVRVSPAWPADPRLMGHLVREAWPVGLLAFVGLGRLHADRLLTTLLLGTVATGQLQAASIVVFGVGDLFGGTLLLAGLPAMSRAWSAGRRGEFWRTLERVAGAGVGLVLPTAVAFALFGERLVAAAIGEAYARTAQVLVLLLAAATLTMAAGPMAQALLCQRRQRALLSLRTLLLVVHLAALAILLPRIGVVGAGWAALATEACAVLALGATLGLGRGTVGPALAARCGRMLAAVALAGLAAVATESIAPAAVAMGVFAVAYAVAVRATRGISDDEWAALLASLHHPDRPSATLPADFPSTQPESAWTRELRALGHQARVFWRNVDSMEAFRPLVMRQRLTLARALRALATRAPRLDPRVRRRNARLVALARDLRPDIVVVLGNNAEVVPDTLARIKRDTGALVVYGCGDSPRVFARPVERDAAPLYDLVIANDATHAAEWRALGAPRAEVLPMAAADPEACAFAPLTDEQRASWACDVGFAGTLVPASLYGRRVEALEALRDLDLAIWSVHEVPPSLRRFHRGALVGPPMLRALSAARIVPNPHGDTMPDGGNMRMF
ncbi:MAG: hypothetical protein MUF60_11665, partial [Vicinamibacterales bacterium]|nr:hypothetical protein [Vicinamibacterales bacterium]